MPPRKSVAGRRLSIHENFRAAEDVDARARNKIARANFVRRGLCVTPSSAHAMIRFARAIYGSQISSNRLAR